MRQAQNLLRHELEYSNGKTAESYKFIRLCVIFMITVENKQLPQKCVRNLSTVERVTMSDRSVVLLETRGTV